ncbi:MAG TPA: hypothetical protein VNM37_21015, partial [Candidatus Dormibacteraeota bacterium]|nr:hypothetical protein [Candidatus Dormibacteraeota bacterium]
MAVAVVATISLGSFFLFSRLLDRPTTHSSQTAPAPPPPPLALTSNAPNPPPEAQAKLPPAEAGAPPERGDRATELFQQGKYAEALELYAQAVKA